MKLQLCPNSPLDKIYAEFKKYFPGLKLEFVFHGDKKLNFSSHHPYSFFFTPVKKFYPDCTVENINIEESMTTKEVEELFKNYWNLPVKVYAIIDGYWQKNRKIEGSQLKEYILPTLKN